MRLFGNTAITLALFAFPSAANADAQLPEWYGTWAMSLDGRPGTLTISDSKADCASSAWCAMVVSYRGSDGVVVRGTIEVVDNRWQHMRFRLGFPGNNQVFNAYLFSWDKRKLAGTTIWGGRTFGFSASK